MVIVDWILPLATLAWGSVGVLLDFSRRRLPNPWLLAGLLLLPLQWLAGGGPDVDDRLLGMLIAALLLGPGFGFGVLGGGDLKLGILAGLLWGSAALLVGVLAAGLWALFAALTTGLGSGRRFPFAVAFLPGAILTWMLVS